MNNSLSAINTFQRLNLNGDMSPKDLLKLSIKTGLLNEAELSAISTLIEVLSMEGVDQFLGEGIFGKFGNKNTVGQSNVNRVKSKLGVDDVKRVTIIKAIIKVLKEVIVKKRKNQPQGPSIKAIGMAKMFSDKLKKKVANRKANNNRKMANAKKLNEAILATVDVLTKNNAPGAAVESHPITSNNNGGAELEEAIEAEEDVARSLENVLKNLRAMRTNNILNNKGNNTNKLKAIKKELANRKNELSTYFSGNGAIRYNANFSKEQQGIIEEVLDELPPAVMVARKNIQ